MQEWQCNAGPTIEVDRGQAPCVQKRRHASTRKRTMRGQRVSKVREQRSRATRGVGRHHMHVCLTGPRCRREGMKRSSRAAGCGTENEAKRGSYRRCCRGARTEVHEQPPASNHRPEAACIRAAFVPLPACHCKWVGKTASSEAARGRGDEALCRQHTPGH